jgi:hypothetical protein
VETIELVREFVLTYTPPRPCVVEVRLAVLMYSAVPRPWLVDVVALIKSCVVEISERVLTYKAVPRPWTVDVSVAELT